jgi:inner membrane protein
VAGFCCSFGQAFADGCVFVHTDAWPGRPRSGWTDAGVSNAVAERRSCSAVLGRVEELQGHGLLMSLVLGLSLIGIGLTLLLIEAFNPGFFVAVPGTVAFVLGLVALLLPDFYTYPTAWLLIIVFTAAVTWVAIRVYKRIAPPEKSTTTFTVDNIVGQVGRAASAISAEAGEVRIHGETWHARSSTPIAEGATIRVVGVAGNFTVNVEAVEAP